MNQHHPVFYKFQPYCGIVERGFQVDFIGARSRCEFVSGAAVLPTATVQTGYPPVDEEYFEWIDVLESVVAAKSTYTMIELGAGYGRWAVRASWAVRRYRGGPYHLIAVEPEPSHFRWLGIHLRDNGIDPSEHTLIQGAVSDKSGDVFFYVGMPGGGKDRPSEWYGQAMAGQHEVIETRCRKTYDGLDIFEHKSGWKSIKVRSVRLATLVESIEKIDLIDLDVQGEELNVLSCAIKDVNRKVVRLHIGTHSHDIEKGLRKLLMDQGWNCIADYQCASTTETLWGLVKFGDGVQSWINPKLA